MISSPIGAKHAEMLSKLWADGLSTKEIAGKLGGGVTAAGIDGEARRLGLPERRAVWDARLAKIRFRPADNGKAPAPQGEFEMPPRQQTDWTPTESLVIRTMWPTEGAVQLDLPSDKEPIKRRSRRR